MGRNSQENLNNRIIKEANYLIEHNSTIRKVATEFKIPKSTIHIDITRRLKTINYELYTQVRGVLNINIAERAARGGEATRRKYILRSIVAGTIIQ